MLSPKAAFDKLIAEDLCGFDDPTIFHYAHRWYWLDMGEGKFCLADAAWRCIPTIHEQHIKPKADGV